MGLISKPNVALVDVFISRVFKCMQAGSGPDLPSPGIEQCAVMGDLHHALEAGVVIRTIVVEPLDLTISQPAETPEHVPVPEPEPEQVPVAL